MNWIVQNYDVILDVAAKVIAVASVVVKLTPTDHDNLILDKLIGLFQFFALNKKGVS